MSNFVPYATSAPGGVGYLGPTGTAFYQRAPTWVPASTAAVVRKEHCASNWWWWLLALLVLGLLVLALVWWYSRTHPHPTPTLQTITWNPASIQGGIH